MSTKEIEKLRITAYRAADVCINIFKDYSEEEIKHLPPSIQRAWEIGKEQCQ